MKYMIKIIIVDLGGVYFKHGTRLFLIKIRKLIDAPYKKISEIFESSNGDGLQYRRGKLTKEEFWKRAVKGSKLIKK